MNNLNKKYICIGASVLIAISAFLPYLTVSAFGYSASASLTNGADGYILLAIAAVGLIFSALEKYIPAIVAGIASLVLFFIENGHVAKSLSGANSLARSYLHNGIGFYTLLIGSLVLIVFGFLAWNDRKKQ